MDRNIFYENTILCFKNLFKRINLKIKTADELGYKFLTSEINKGKTMYELNENTKIRLLKLLKTNKYYNLWKNYNDSKYYITEKQKFINIIEYNMDEWFDGSEEIAIYEFINNFYTQNKKNKTELSTKDIHQIVKYLKQNLSYKKIWENGILNGLSKKKRADKIFSHFDVDIHNYLSRIRPSIILDFIINYYDKIEGEIIYELSYNSKISILKQLKTDKYYKIWESNTNLSEEEKAKEIVDLLEKKERQPWLTIKRKYGINFIIDYYTKNEKGEDIMNKELSISERIINAVEDTKNVTTESIIDNIQMKGGEIIITNIKTLLCSFLNLSEEVQKKLDNNLADFVIGQVGSVGINLIKNKSKTMIAIQKSMISSTTNKPIMEFDIQGIIDKLLDKVLKGVDINTFGGEDKSKDESKKDSLSESES